MRNRSDSARQSAKSKSVADLKRGMGIWVWSRRPARIAKSHGDGTYEVVYTGGGEVSTRIDRNDLNPMALSEREQYLPRPRLQPDREGQPPRTPLRKLMDEVPLSRSQMIQALEFSPPKVDRLIASPLLPLDVAVLVATVLNVEVDPEAVTEGEREHLSKALEAAREGAKPERGERRKRSETKGDG